MNRYINADKYEQDLRRMTEIVHETGHAPGISGELVKSLRAAFIVGVKAAITQLSVEPGWERVDVKNHRLLPERDAVDDNYKERLKVRMAEELGKYAVEQGLATFEEAPDWVGGELRMHAAFLRPIEPKFNPLPEPPEKEEQG